MADALFYNNNHLDYLSETDIWYPGEIVGGENYDGGYRRSGQHSIQGSVSSVRDGKLFLRVRGVVGPPSNFNFCLCRGFRCEISMDGNLQTLPISFSSSSQLNQSQTLAFDVFEYYGPSSLKFSIFTRGLFFTQRVAARSITLHDIVLLQDKTLAMRRQVSSVHVGESKEDKHMWLDFEENSPDLFWGCEGVIELENASLSSPIATSSKFQLFFQARYIPLQQCVGVTAGVERYSDLHHVARFGTANVMQAMLDALARRTVLRSAMGLRAAGGLSVLDGAVAARNVNVVRLLLQRAGNLCFQGITRRHFPTLVLAVATGRVDILRLLLRFLSKYSVALSIWEGSPSDLLDWQYAMDETGGRTPLMEACRSANVRMVEILIKAGADSGAISEGESRRHALMFAVESGSRAVVELLLRDKRDTQSVDLLSGQQPVPLALFRCRPCEKDSAGNQAIMLAALLGHLDVFTLLLTHGIPHDCINNRGDNCLHLAASRGHRQLCLCIIAAEQRAWKVHRSMRSASLARLQFRPKLLLQLNAAGRRPGDLARAASHVDLAREIEEAAKALYGGGDISSPSEGNVTPPETVPADASVDSDAEEEEYKLALMKVPAALPTTTLEVRGAVEGGEMEVEEEVEERPSIAEMSLDANAMRTPPPAATAAATTSEAKTSSVHRHYEGSSVQS